MSGPFGAAPKRVELRPRTPEIPLGIVHPDDAFADGDDYRWSLYEAEQRRDRLDDHTPVGLAPAKVIALPVGERDQRQAA